jgi:hypothetical protein
VLEECLEITEDELATLEEAGVIAAEPRQGMVARGTMDLETMLAERRLREVDPDCRQSIEDHLAT